MKWSEPKRALSESIITWSLTGSEPRKVLPAKVSQEPDSKARLATCPLILNLIGPYSSSARSWGRRDDLGLLAQP